MASVVTDVQFNLFYETRTWFSLARALWLRGFRDRGCKVALQTISKSAEYSQSPFILRRPRPFDSRLALETARYASAADPIELAIAQARKYSLPTFHTLGLALKGELKLAGGDISSGVEILRGTLTTMIAEQYHVVRSPTSRALAEGLVLSGRADEALTTIEEAVARAEQVNELLWATRSAADAR